MINNHKYNKVIFLNNFPYTGEYKLNVEIKKDNQSKCQTVASIEIASRANFQTASIWFWLGTFFAVILGVIGYFIGGK